MDSGLDLQVAHHTTVSCVEELVVFLIGEAGAIVMDLVAHEPNADRCWCHKHAVTTEQLLSVLSESHVFGSD